MKSGDSTWNRAKFGDDATVLVLGPHDDRQVLKRCKSLLTTPAPVPETVLVLSYQSNQHTDILAWMEGENSYVPPNWRTIRVGDPALHRGEGNGTAVPQISDPSHYIETRNALSQALQERSTPAVVFIDSITTIVQQIDYSIAYLLIENLLGLVAANGAATFVRMDPGQHTRETVESFQALFDATVELSPEDGTWQITED